MENIIEITKSDGTKYSVRKDRHRYFFPKEWVKFIATVKNPKHNLMFNTLLHTGARIMEGLHLRPCDFDFERKTVSLKVIKQRKAKKSYSGISTSRTFFVSPKYLRQVKAYINKNKIKQNQYLFLNNETLPPNYVDLSNLEKKPYYFSNIVAYNQLFKRKLKEAGIKDPHNFSLHNIRKTNGNYLRVLNIRMEELCYRLGHDYKTYQTHYGSNLIFTDTERMKIQEILGDVR